MGYLLARETVNGAKGSAFITLNGRNIEIAGLRNINVQAEIQSEDMRVVGTTSIQDKYTGVKLTGTGNVYYGTSIFNDIVLEYINTGVMPEFDIQITNDDDTTELGKQTLVYYGCHLTGNVPMAVLNSEEAMLNFDFNFTATRVARLEAFRA